MYRISHIYVENFRGSRKINLKFPNDSVTIIHGTNGSGKTTLLKVIHGILDFNSSILESEKITNAIIKFSDWNDNKDIILAVEYSEEENEYKWSTDTDDFNKIHSSLSSIVFGVNRGTTNTTIGKLTSLDVLKATKKFNLKVEASHNNTVPASKVLDDISEFLNRQMIVRTRRNRRNQVDIDYEKQHLMIDNFPMSHVEEALFSRHLWEKKYMSDRVQKALFETLALVLDNQINNKNFEHTPEDFLEKLFFYRETLIEVLSELEGNELSEKILKILKKYDPQTSNGLKNPFEGKELMSNLLYNMIVELEKGSGVLNSVTQLIEEFNSYLSPSKKLVIDEKGPRVKTFNSEHGIEKLSSGERHLLSFLTLFIIEGRDRNILMIDEPEISLNLEWQGKLLKLLTTFVPGSQIIVATHSPAIAEYNTNNLVEIIE
ncbi:hypothetical protein COF44_13695 [Bacillus toyonensis]|uniref:AAA family ATPase n=1 Tax=Bacillus toyonensis TaxID=155322 RepID=UPI000BFC8F0B|nr:AAA family ATPase [Bacillus toyonensis]PHD00277.1 hypothetical protein COF44_13695 [Bacillus toyonensis]